MRNARNFLILMALLLPADPGQAQEGPDPAARPNAYALVVGSNRGGPGQEDLRFAREDALRFLELLTEVGGYHRGNVRLVLDPGRRDLLASLAQVRGKLSAHAEKDEQSLFLFYYSGHARAHGLNMGEEELPLTDLRAQLESMPATVTVAILDACQTGAISRVKGAEPAVDFSYNSVNNLNTAGIAVMASSSASELSQESETLGASYFTHHLLTGLRGAADGDTDGRISLSEAYTYAYNRTLVATAKTAVGKQHVTLETDLRGKGDMILTYPAAASAALILPAGLAGDVLIHRGEKKTVVAEVAKAEADRIRLALPAGGYVAFLRKGAGILKCEVVLEDGGAHELDPGACEEARPDEILVKGPAEPWREQFALEVGVGVLSVGSDSYDQRLIDFGYEEDRFDFGLRWHASVSFLYNFNRYLSVGAGWFLLDSNAYRRTVFDLGGEERVQRFEWSAHALGVFLRGTLPLFDGVLNPYVQAGGGLSWGTTVFRDPLQASEVVDDELFWGYHLSVAAGVHFMPWRHLGIFGQIGYVHAPAVENLTGDVHDSGGPVIFLGVRGAL